MLQLVVLAASALLQPNMRPLGAMATFRALPAAPPRVQARRLAHGRRAARRLLPGGLPRRRRARLPAVALGGGQARVREGDRHAARRLP